MMGYSIHRGGILARSANRAAALIAFLAIALHVAMPVVYDLAGPAAQGLISTVICAGGEATHVYLGKDGKPTTPAPSGNHDCKGCAFHGVTTVALSSQIIAPVWANYLPPAAEVHPAYQLRFAAAEARAPPA